MLEKTVRIAWHFSSCRWLAASALLSVALILHIFSNLWCSENKVLIFIISLDFNSPLTVIVILVNLVNNYKISHLRNKFFLCFKYIYFFLVNSFIYFHNLCFRIWEIGLLFVTVILFIWIVSLHFICGFVLFCALKNVFYIDGRFFSFLAFSEKPEQMVVFTFLLGELGEFLCQKYDGIVMNFVNIQFRYLK